MQAVGQTGRCLWKCNVSRASLAQQSADTGSEAGFMLPVAHHGMDHGMEYHFNVRPRVMINVSCISIAVVKNAVFGEAAKTRSDED